MRRETVLLLCLVTTGTGCAGSGTAAPAPTVRIFLARHGQTDWNLERRLQGHTDRELNETGRSQAAALAATLRGVRLDRVYSSTLRRSRESADLVRGEAPLESLPGLDERRLGKFEGVRLDGSDPEAAAEYQRRSGDPQDRLDGGESLDEHDARVSDTVASIRSRHPEGAVLIVGHGGTNALVLRALLGWSLEESLAVHQSNDEVYLIELAPGAEPLLFKLVGEANRQDL